MYDQNPVLDSDVFIALWKNIFFMKDYEYVCFILFKVKCYGIIVNFSSI